MKAMGEVVEPGASSVPLLLKDTHAEREGEGEGHPGQNQVESPDDRQLICFNVGGKKFYVVRENFLCFPNTRLGRLVRCKSREEVEGLCDKFLEDGELQEFFFDRNWKGFNNILDVYRLGRLHLTSGGLCPMRTRALIDYWQIDELLLDACCALKFYPSIEECTRETLAQEETERKFLERETLEDFGRSTIGRLRKNCWNLTEYPETSIWARLYAFTSMGVVIISTIVFVLSTIPELTDELDFVLFYNQTANTTTAATGVERWEDGIIALNIIDHTTMVFFTLEFLLRLLCSPQKLVFMKAPLNIIDMLAILPYYVGFLLKGMQDTLVVGRVGKVLRLVRVMRILRVFKLVRHFNGLQSLLSTLGQAYKELGLLMVLLFVCILTFASLIYFAEKDSISKWSFTDSFWWGLMVLTTVGYGQRMPESGAGQLIGGFAALLSVFILALPVPIIVNSFAENFKNRMWKGQVMMKKSERKDLGDRTGGPIMITREGSSQSLKRNKVSPGSIEDSSRTRPNGLEGTLGGTYCEDSGRP